MCSRVLLGRSEAMQLTRWMAGLAVAAGALGSFGAGQAAGHGTGQPKHNYYAARINGYPNFVCAAGANQLQEASDGGPWALTISYSSANVFCEQPWPRSAGSIRAKHWFYRYVDGHPSVCGQPQQVVNPNTAAQATVSTYWATCGLGDYRNTSEHRVIVNGATRLGYSYSALHTFK
jgi:hypothetical protein